MKKYHIGQTALIAVLALLTLLSAFVSVLSLIPVNTPVEIKETLTASSSMVNSADQTYLVSVVGSLRNPTDQPVTVERLEVTVIASGSKDDLQILFENLTVPPRSALPVSKVVQGQVYGKAVGEVRAVIDGEELFLRNPAGTDLSAAILPILITAVAAFFTVKACKVRYYMAQEDRMDSQA